MSGHVRLSHLVLGKDAERLALFTEPVIVQVTNCYDVALMKILGSAQGNLARAGARFTFEKSFADLVLKHGSIKLI